LSGFNIEKFRPVAYYFKGSDVVYLNPAYSPNPFLPFSLRPNDMRYLFYKNQFDNTIGVFKYNTNAFGFRGKQITLEKPENCLRIICLGGSTTFSASDDENTWSAKLEKLLQGYFLDKKIEVLNFGISGASSPFSLVMLALKGIHFKPDLVIVYDGFNDIWHGMGFKDGINTDYTPYIKDMDFPNRLQNAVGYLKRVIMPRFLYNSYFFSMSDYLFDRFVLNRCEDMSVHYINKMDKDTKTPLKGKEIFIDNLRSILGIAMFHNAKVLLSTLHTFDNDSNVIQLNSDIVALAAQLNINIVDQAKLIPHNDKSIHIDNVHFTPYGDEIIARNFYEAILKYELLEK